MSKDLFLKLTQDNKKDNEIYNQEDSYFDTDYSFLDEPEEDYDLLGENAWRNLGRGLIKGAASGVTFGASEFAPGMQVDLSEMTGAEKAGYILGEGATMLIPFMGFGKAAKGLTALHKYGAKGAIKKVAKETIKDSDIATAGALKQAKKIAKATGRTTDEVIAEIAPNLQKKIYKDLTKKEARSVINPMRKPFLEDVYNQAAKGDLKKFSNDAIRNRVRASLQMGLGEQGIKLGSRQLDNIADNFAAQIGKGVRFNDASMAFATRFGRNVDPGRIARYLGMAGNMSAMMITDQMIRQAMHHKTRGTEFDPMAAVQGGIFMGLAFPAIQAIPNIKGFGTGYRSFWQEGAPMLFNRVLRRFNYSKIAERVGEKPVRGLLKMQTKGGLFDVTNSSRLGDAFWKVGKGYEGAYDVLRKIDTMPLDDVIGLLNAYKKQIGKEVSKKWLKDWFKDTAGSIPRMISGVSTMMFPTFQEYFMGRLGNEELYAHMITSAFMTKSRGGWGMTKEYNYQADFAPYKKALDNMGLKGETLKEMINIVDDTDSKIFGASMKDNKVVKEIENVFDTFADPEATPDEARNGFNSMDHEIVDRWQYVYNAAKKEQQGLDRPFEEIDVKSKNYTKSELDNIANELRKIEFDDGVSIADIGRRRFNARITEESANKTAQAYEYLMKDFQERGLPVIEIPTNMKTGKVQFQVGLIRPETNGKDMGELMTYNNLMRRLDDLGVVKIMDNMKVPERAFDNDDFKIGLDDAFETTIFGLNNEFNLPKIAHKIDDNDYLNLIGKRNQMQAIERMFKILEGTGQTETDINLATTAVRLFDRGVSEPGFLNSIENYQFDYKTYADKIGKSVSDVKKEFDEADLRGQLRPLLEMLRVSNHGVVKNPSVSQKKVDIESAKQIADQFKDITNLLPRDLQQEFGTKGLDFFMKDMLASQNIKPRVVNSIVELQELGLGSYNIKNKKVDVMAIESFDAQAESEGITDINAIEDIKNKAIQIYDAIGSEYVNQIPFIISPTADKNYKSPSIGDFLKVYDNFQIEKINDFTRNAESTLDLIKSTGSYTEGKLDNVASSLAKVASDPMNLETLNRLQDISVELKNLRHGDKFGKTYDKLIKELDKLRNDVARVTDGTEIEGSAQELDMLGRVKNMHEYIQDMLSKEASGGEALQKMVTDIVANNRDGRFSRSVAARLNEKVSSELKKLLKDQKTNTMSLDELILEVNETGSWNAAKNLLKGLQNQVDIQLSQHDKLNLKPTEQESFERLADDKKIHHSSETIQTIAQRYGLLNPDNPNDVNTEILGYIVDNKNSANLISGLSDKVFKSIDRMRLKPSESSKLKADWDNFKYGFANSILRRKTRQTGNIIFDGEKVLLNVNSQSSFRVTPVNEWIDAKGYDITYLNDRIISPNKRGILKQGGINSLDIKRSSNISINDAIRKGVQVIPEANYDIMKEIGEGNKIDGKKIAQYQNEAKTGHYIEDGGFYIRLTPGNRILFHGTKDNYQKLNNDFKAFYDKTSKYDFKDVETTSPDGTKRTIRSEKIQESFENIFGGLRDIENPTIQQSQLKMHGIFYSDASKGMFGEWLAANKIGNHDLRRKIEANMIKRGYLIDGGTTIKPHPTVIKDMASNHFDQDVRNVANEISNNKMKTKTILFDDEANNAGTNIVKRVKEQFATKKASVAGDRVSEYIYDQMMADIDAKAIPSLDMPLTDGAKYIDKGLAKLLLSIKGQDPSQLGGIKTIIFQLGDNNLLGKGYAVYDPIVAAEFPSGVRFALGKSSAKDYTKSEKEALSVVGKEWYKSLANATNDNIIDLNIENIGVGFTSKPTEGVTISNSMLHLESIDYKKRAMEDDFIGLNRTLDVLDRTTQQKLDSEGELISYLKQIKEDEGFTQTEGELGLTSDLIQMGGAYGNPAIKKSADRALRNKYFQLLSQQTTQFGRDMTIVPDSESNLMMPEIVEFASSSLPNAAKMRANKTFGDVAPDIQGMSDPLPNLNNTSFIVNYKGIDFIVNSKNKGRVYSPFVEKLSSNKDLVLKGDNAPPIPDTWRNKKALYDDVLNGVNPIIEKLNQKFTNTSLSMADIYNLLNGKKVPRSHTKIKFTKAELDIVKKFDMTLGASGIAIPLKGYDKVVHRIRNAHNDQGLVRINHYDERVVHQRDNDGDHFYLYYQVPFSMETIHAKKQAFMKDFKMLKKESPDINLFGIDENRPNSRAGSVTDVGGSKYLDHLDNQRFGIGKTIGDRGALDLLMTLGWKKGDQSIVRDLSNIEDLNTPDAELGRRTFTLFQNTVDIHGGTAKIMDNKYISDYYRHGDMPIGMKQKFEDGTDIDFTNASLFDEFGRRGDYVNLERDMTNIALRTIKGINILGSDVFQDGMQRAPEPFEISNAYYDLKTFFSNPNYFMVSKLKDEYIRTNNKQGLYDLVEYFYQGVQRKAVDGDRIDKFIEGMKKGRISSNFNKNNTLSFSAFINPGKQFKDNNFDMFDVIPQGKYLREVVQKSIFKDSELMGDVKGDLHTKLGSIVQDALDRITFLESSGRRIEEIADEFFWDDNVVDFKKPDAVELPGAIGRGAIRTALNGMYSRLASQAKHYNRTNTKYDDGKLDRIKFKMKNVESALAVLDAQFAKGVIGGGATKAIFKTHNDKKGKNFLANDSYILSYKGSEANISKLIEENKLDLSQFYRVGWKKKGEFYKTYSGNTYIEMKNPIVHESVSKEQKIYSKALLHVTDQTRVESIFPGDDILQLNFIDQVLQVRKDINDNFSGAINNSKNKAISKRVWAMNDAKEKSILHKFYNENMKLLMDNNPDMDDVDAAKWLTKYLIKPQPLMGKYESKNVDGSKIDLPYYSMNNRLVSSVYKYLKSKEMMPIVEDIVRAQEKYVRGEWTEADDFVDSNYNMYQDGYNWDNLEGMSDVVKSLSGSGFYSPFWKHIKGQKGFDYTNPDVLKTFDNAKIGVTKKPLKNESDCR